ncbi:glycosyl transferase, partial [bacterium F11]
MVSYLTEALVEHGHEVTLFASGDSITKANLKPPCHLSLRLDKTCIDRFASHALMLEQLLHVAHNFDILHFHIDYLGYSLIRRLGMPAVTTLH